MLVATVFAAGLLMFSQETWAQGFPTLIGQSADRLNAIMAARPTEIFLDYVKTAAGPVVDSSALTPRGVGVLGRAADLAGVVSAYQSDGNLGAAQKVSEMIAVESAQAAAGLAAAPFGPNAVVGAKVVTGVVTQGVIDLGTKYVAPKIGDALAPYTADGRYASAIEAKIAAAGSPDPFGSNAAQRRQAAAAAAEKAAAEKSVLLTTITQQREKAEGDYQAYLYQKCLGDAYSIKSTCAATFPQGAATTKQQQATAPVKPSLPAAPNSVASASPAQPVGRPGGGSNAQTMPSVSTSLLSVKSGQLLTASEAIVAIGKGASPQSLRRLTAIESIEAIGEGLNPDGLWVLQSSGQKQTQTQSAMPAITGAPSGNAFDSNQIAAGQPPGCYAVSQLFTGAQRADFGRQLGCNFPNGGRPIQSAMVPSVQPAATPPLAGLSAWPSIAPPSVPSGPCAAAGMQLAQTARIGETAQAYVARINPVLQSQGCPNAVVGSPPVAARNTNLASLGVSPKQVAAARAAPKTNNAGPTQTTVTEAAGRPPSVKTPAQIEAARQARAQEARALAQAQYQQAVQNQQNAEIAQALILGIMSGVASGAMSAPRAYAPAPRAWSGGRSCMIMMGPAAMGVRAC